VPRGPGRAPVLRDRERERAELGAETSSVFQFVIAVVDVVLRE
jgi:hypothetical protein